jgi:hypothetical protein
LGDASQYGRVIYPEALGGGPHGASACGSKKVANVVPVDHGAIPHHAVRLSNARIYHIEQQYGLSSLPMTTNTIQPRMANTDHRGPRQLSNRIDFAPPICAFPH